MPLLAIPTIAVCGLQSLASLHRFIIESPVDVYVSHIPSLNIAPKGGRF